MSLFLGTFLVIGALVLAAQLYCYQKRAEG